MRRMLERIALGRKRGNLGEDAAARYLTSLGYRILHRNWRHGRLEIDIICRHGDTLVFVEVKTRGAGSLATASEVLTPAKCAVLVRAARQYLAHHKCWDEPCRFDFVAVQETETGLDVSHFVDAFQS